MYKGNYDKTAILPPQYFSLLYPCIAQCNISGLSQFISVVDAVDSQVKMKFVSPSSFPKCQIHKDPGQIKIFFKKSVINCKGIFTVAPEYPKHNLRYFLKKNLIQVAFIRFVCLKYVCLGVSVD